MSKTDEQYLEYLKQTIRAKEAALELVKAQEAAEAGPARQLYRVRSNGAGSFTFHKGRWNRTDGQ